MYFKNNPAIAVVMQDEDVLSVPPDRLKGADLIELRVDMFKNPHRYKEIFSMAKSKYELPILCTVRAVNEGGRREIKDRLKIYLEIADYCSFFDIEIFSEECEDLRKITRQRNITLIGSYHNFNCTPEEKALESIFQRGRAIGVDILKIATMVNSRADLERLLLFTLKHKDEGIIVIGMGQKGVPSRVVNPIFGSLLTYASLNEASAPGQINLKEMVYIFERLEIRKKPEAKSSASG